MDINLSIRDRAGKTFTLKTSEEARSLLEAEVQYWSEAKAKLGKNLTGALPSIPQNIKAFLDQLKFFEEAESSDPKPSNINQVNQKFQQSKQQFTNWATQNWIYRGNAFTEAMLAAFEYSQESGNAFLDAIINNRAHLHGNPPSLNTFTGILMAYEYYFQDRSHLVKRRNAEKKSFTTLRNDLEDERNRLVSEIVEFRNEIDSWKDGTQEDFKGWFGRIQKQTAEWFTHHKERSDEAIDDHSALFNKMADHAVSRVQELEELYREKLRLAAPATYWANRARNLNFQGLLWACLLIVTSVATIAGAGCFFWGWLHKEPVPFGLQSLQGVALFGATAAAAVFLIRMLSKLTFSAFHLQRDAEEREQLTHLYLALIHEGALDTDSRDIVLQALFSRADSGLLGGDHGPTMPSPADIIAGVSRVKS
ncbi:MULTISPECIES: DUF6161 domain-containing protein [Gammaproteobacteria]|uniref:DUF6161 domain-containing protein n=1 Tax=Gammaproteobacteria TaxID=1236 RepID=UPI0007932179|nr:MULTISPECIES: DUF6161 domain-containing protein [Gammaproteobacteria]KXJ47347.1 MAG: hypothetical protein AXW11_20565 [Marinobacter sp. Hex_13]MEE3387361.1 DUF6161 domain-containing protein [Pseudomonadota bacterium]SEF83115.1 hypothetical protein SAMN04515663_1043 [Alcanivorax sp. DSM 26293]